MPILRAMSDLSADSTAEEARTERRHYFVELWTAVLLGLATVGAAYAAYQASLYDGNSLDRYSEGIAKSAEASGKQLEAQGGFTLDMVTWMEWQSRVISAGGGGAQAKSDDIIASSIYEDFMEERLKAALEWSDKESKSRGDFSHPTESPDYAIELFQPALETQEAAATAMSEARKANDIGDQFTLVTVLYTIVLFFSGIATVFKSDRVKLVLLGMAAILFLATTLKLLMLPAAG